MSESANRPDSAGGLRELLVAARDLVGRETLLALVLAAGVLVCCVIGIAIALGGSDSWQAPSALPLAVDLALVGMMLGGGLWLRRRWLGSLDETRIAGEAERGAGLSSGSVRGALELLSALPPGASPNLAARAEARARASLAGRGPRELGGALADAGRRRRRRLAAAFGIGVVGLLGAGLGMPEASARGVRPLLDPIRHLSRPPLPPVRVDPGNATVPRGEMLTVGIHAPHRTEARVRWWSAGELPKEARLALDRSPRAGGILAIGPIDALTRYIVRTSDSAVSDTFTVEPLDPLMLAELEVEARYPAYLGRAAETFGQPLPTLLVPEGTELRIRGRATAPLSAAELRPTAHERGPAAGADEPAESDSGGVGTVGVPLVVEGAVLSGSWRPTRSGEYAWRLLDHAATPVVAPPAPLRVEVIGDRAPSVRVTFPGVDTTMPPSLRLEILADAQDDHGLASAEIVSWRVSSVGRRDEPVAQTTAIGNAPGRALLRGVLELEERGLLPGDTLKYLVRVRDNSPRGQTTESRTYALVFPSMSRLREAVGEEADRMMDDAGQLARRAEELATEVRDAGRRMRRDGRQTPRGSSDESSMSFEEADQLQRLADEDEQMLREVQQMSERLESLQRAMESAGLQDAELQQQLDELRELYQDVLTEELRSQLQELQRALDDLDPEQVQAALERLAEQQEQVREQLERSLELFRRAAAEQELTALAQDAREAAARQEALAAAFGDSTSAARALPEQSVVEADAAQLEERIGELAERLDAMGEQSAAQQLGRAGEQAQSAQQSMQSASEQARSGENAAAEQQAQQAAQQMTAMAEGMDAARDQMADAWRQEARQAVQQATQDVLSLAQEQEALRQRMADAGRSGGVSTSSGSNGRSGMQATSSGSEGRNGMQADQAALQQGLGATGRNLSEAGQRSAMVSREVGAALGRGMVQMERVQERLGDPDAPLPVEQARQAVEALNQLAMELLANAERIDRSGSGTGLQEALEQLAQMAQQQGALNAQAGAMMPLALPGAQMQAQAERLAQRQRSIGAGLEQVQRDMGDRGDVLGRVDQLAQEAADIARDLEEQGVRPETLARQERLFHRLLDAGRSLERDETSDERRAERPGSAGAVRPPALDASVTAGPLYPPPSDEELRRLSPAYRRLILDYFERLNRAPAEGQR